MLDDYHDEDAPPPRRHLAFTAWLVCAAILLVPSLTVWFVRLWALAAQCAPGHEPCRGVAFGGGLRDLLALAWFVGSNTLLTFLLAFAAAIAALSCRRPLLAALTMLTFPLLSLLLPMFAVQSALYAGCKPNEAGVGDCTLWGAQMGTSFHQAAGALQQVYDIVAFDFALGIMVGVIGFLFFRPEKV